MKKLSLLTVLFLFAAMPIFAGNSPEIRQFHAVFQSGSFTGYAVIIDHSGQGIKSFDFGSIYGVKKDGSQVQLGYGACYIVGSELLSTKNPYIWTFQATLRDLRLDNSYEYIMCAGKVRDGAGNIAEKKVKGYPLREISARLQVSNYPNPFNPVTTIAYQLDQPADVQLTVYNSLGQQVATLVNQHQNSGEYAVKFNGANLASGTYFYRLKVGQKILIKRMFLLK